MEARVDACESFAVRRKTRVQPAIDSIASRTCVGATRVTRPPRWRCASVAVTALSFRRARFSSTAAVCDEASSARCNRMSPIRPTMIISVADVVETSIIPPRSSRVMDFHVRTLRREKAAGARKRTCPGGYASRCTPGRCGRSCAFCARASVACGNATDA